MPKDKSSKKSNALRHNPLGEEIEKQNSTTVDVKPKKRQHFRKQDEDETETADGNFIPATIEQKIQSQARDQQKMELASNEIAAGQPIPMTDSDEDDELDGEDDLVEEEGEAEDLVEFDGERVAGVMCEEEAALIQKFLHAGNSEVRTLADIIMDKIRERNEDDAMAQALPATVKELPPKVVEVYTSVGKLLHHYKSGKLPKALKMLPHLKNWEEILWLTRPDEWSSCATYACTRIFASNLNAKMAQRFFNLVLLEKCRDDIRRNKTLNYHLYMALKKALFKPAAFYKGVLLPLAQSQTCTLREATIFASVLAKVSIPGNHSAAALMRLVEMPYSGSNSLFIKVLLNKRYALPRRVIDGLLDHFCAFENESRDLPIIWHQALLVFAQRYKLELDDASRERLKALMKAQNHYQITPEIRRELFGTAQ